MRKLKIKTLAALVSLMFLFGCAGQEINFSNMLKKEAPTTFETVGLQSLSSSINQAAMATHITDFKSLPFVLIGENAKIEIEKTPNTTSFMTESLLTVNYKQNPDGLESFDFMSESGDVFGRKDRRIGAISYRAQKPNHTQTTKIQKWLLKQDKALSTKKDPAYKNAVIGFQAEGNLSQDGQFGPKTAKSLAQNMAMINIEALDNHIFYPEKPNHMLFILPYDVFRKNEAKLSQGFQSLLEVGKLGIAKDEFKNIARQGEKYILLVYFFDRVNPTFAINIGFSTAAKQWDSQSSSRQKYYPTPNLWPVIVEEFTVSETLPEKLFVNIFLKESRVKFRCAGSHQLF